MSKKSTRRQKRRVRHRTQVRRKRLRRRTRRMRRKRRRKVRVQRGGVFGPMPFGMNPQQPPAAVGLGRPDRYESSGSRWRTYSTPYFDNHLRPLSAIEWWYFVQRIAQDFLAYRKAMGLGPPITNSGWGWSPGQTGYYLNTDDPTAHSGPNTTPTHLHMVEAFSMSPPGQALDLADRFRAVFVAKYNNQPVNWRGGGNGQNNRVTYIIDGTLPGIAKWAFFSLGEGLRPLRSMAAGAAMGAGAPRADYLAALCAYQPNPLGITAGVSHGAALTKLAVMACAGAGCPANPSRLQKYNYTNLVVQAAPPAQAGPFHW